MSALANLKLTNAKRSNGLPSILVRRAKLLLKLDEQIKLAEAQQQHQLFHATRFKTVKDETGKQQVIEVQRRVRSWWWANETGKICLNIRYGACTLEIAKGKTAVEVGTTAQLIETLNLIKTAIEQGELDAAIADVSSSTRKGFKK